MCNRVDTLIIQDESTLLQLNEKEKKSAIFPFFRIQKPLYQRYLTSSTATAWKEKILT